ncbi:MAG: hypothetical protein A2086_09920 [Spirochaetes bacterium GWD1_27_9]|nr:MAG: hypothetical protein A2Z98_06200 [Spirochaetes bacterium GWB1_27_13]OHD23237.1 MAG: hypothetical protein A2Y34_07390 [Spirochaetes bacterium GWC1_27_15]OHD42049.1 MAG: hypothetical protein A2086_09920 [Spirochaetes bacterium GWD1_27_9]
MNLFKITILLFSLLFLNSLFAEEPTPSEITFTHEDENAYPWVLPDGTGIDIEMMKILEKKINIKIKLQKYPWKRCLELMKSNVVDGAFASSFKTERLEMGHYPTKEDGNIDNSKNIHYSGYSLYILRTSNLEWDGKAFKNLTGKIGIQSGFSIADKLKSLNVQIDEETKSIENNFNKLIKNRIQGLALQTARADFVLSKNKEFSNKIIKYSVDIESKPYFLMLSFDFVKKYPNLSKKIWKSIENIRNSKEYKDKVEDFLSKD